MQRLYVFGRPGHIQPYDIRQLLYNLKQQSLIQTADLETPHGQKANKELTNLKMAKNII